MARRVLKCAGVNAKRGVFLAIAAVLWCSTAVAFLGLAVLLLSGVPTPAHVAKEGDVLATFIWFALVFALCGNLNELGFIAYLGGALSISCCSPTTISQA